jgi:hypothetical protein
MKIFGSSSSSLGQRLGQKTGDKKNLGFPSFYVPTDEEEEEVK